MRRIDFRLDDEWWELAEVLARDLECSIHQAAYTALTNEILLLSVGDSPLGAALRATMDAQRQRDRQRQASDN